MKKNLILITLLMMPAFSTRADKADSLRRVLNSDAGDTTKVMAAVMLARNYYYTKLDSCLRLAQYAIALAKKAGFEKGIAYGQDRMGTIFWLTGNYPKSLDYHLQSLKTFERLHDIEGMNEAYGHLGNVYSDQGDEKLSIAYTWKTKSLTAAMKNPEYLAVPLVNLGDSYEKLNQLDSARIYTNQAFELAERIKNEEIKGIALNNLGNIYSKMGQNEIAMGYYHQSLHIDKKSDFTEVYCETSLGMAKLFKKSGQADSALYYSRLSLVAALGLGYPKYILSASNFLSDYFKSLNKVDSAYRYQQITITAKDSLFSQEKVKAVQNLTFQEQIRQQEIEEVKLKAEEERKANIQMLGIGAFISFFFGILFFFSKKGSHLKTIRFLGLMGLLLLFEFISLFLHPYIAEWTHHIPMLMLVILAGIASVLVPLHHRLQEMVNIWLAKRAYVKAGTDAG